MSDPLSNWANSEHGRSYLKRTQPSDKPRKKKNRPEAAIQKAILEYLAYLPECKAIRINSGATKIGDRYIRMAPAGTADILCCYRGRFVAIEVKAPKGKPSDKQREFLHSINEAGGIGFIARSVDDVQHHLELT